MTDRCHPDEHANRTPISGRRARSQPAQHKLRCMGAKQCGNVGSPVKRRTPQPSPHSAQHSCKGALSVAPTARCTDTVTRHRDTVGALCPSVGLGCHTHVQAQLAWQPRQTLRQRQVLSGVERGACPPASSRARAGIYTRSAGMGAAATCVRPSTCKHHVPPTDRPHRSRRAWALEA